MLKSAFKSIDKCDAYLAIIKNENKSEGLLIEIGYCLANKKKIILLINKSVKNTYLRNIANKVIEFNDRNDMISKLKALKL